MPAGSLSEVLVGGKGEEVQVLLVQDQPTDHVRSRLEVPAEGLGVIDLLAQPLDLLIQQALHQLPGDGPAGVRGDGAVVDLLPDLGAGDLRSGCVLHQVVDGDCALPESQTAV